MPGSSLSVCLSVCLFRLSLIVHHKMYPALTPARASSRPDALCSSFSSSSPFSISSHLRPDPHPVYISISRPSSLARSLFRSFIMSVRSSVCLCAAPPRARIYPHTYSTYEYIHTATYPNPNPSPVLHAPHPHSLFHLPLRYMPLHTPPARPPASRPPITTTT